MQQPQHFVQVGKDMRLRSAQRGQPQPCELALQLSQVVLTQPYVVNEIDGAGGVGRVDRLQAIPKAPLEADQVAAQSSNDLNELRNHALIPGGHERCRLKNFRWRELPCRRASQGSLNRFIAAKAQRQQRGQAHEARFDHMIRVTLHSPGALASRCATSSAEPPIRASMGFNAQWVNYPA